MEAERVVMEKPSGEQNALDVERIRTEVRPIAKLFINKIALYANNKYVDGHRMTAAIACGIMERVLVSTAGRFHQDDRAAGERFIRSVFNASLEDAVTEWRKL